MPSTLSVPRPSNMDTKFGDVVESDMYDIAARVRELDPTLFIVRHPEHERPYVIMEHCRDGNERYVFRTDTLDARIIEKLRYLMNVPFEKRFAEAERAEAQAKADEEKLSQDKLFEAVGAPMQGLLYKTGAIDTRRESYSKAGVYGGRGSKGKS